MNTRLDLGRIAGIPVYLDMLFLLVLVLFSSRYFTSGNLDLASAGLVIVAGLIASIFLHELGHALTGKLFRTSVSHIELTGLGGVTHFDRSLPRSVFARTLIYFAGPLANLLLYHVFGMLTVKAMGSSRQMLAIAMDVLSYANMQLFIFNLLPAYPLDGGHILDAWVERIAGRDWALRIVGGLGLVVAAFLVYLSLPTQFFMLLLALFIAQMNWEALQSAGGLGGRR